MALSNVDRLAVKQQVEATGMNDDQLIVMLNARPTRSPRVVQDVADDDGSSAHPQILMTDVFELFHSRAWAHVRPSPVR